MQCIYCGRNNSDFARTCSKCGRALSKNAGSSVKDVPIKETPINANRVLDNDKTSTNNNSIMYKKPVTEDRPVYSQPPTEQNKPNVSAQEIREKASALFDVAKDKTQDLYSSAQKTIKDVSASGKAKIDDFISSQKEKQPEIQSEAVKSVDESTYTFGVEEHKDDLTSSETKSYSYCEHEYQKLGGWLAFFAYSLLIGVFLVAAIVVVSFISTIYLSRYLGKWVVILSFLSVIAYGPVIYFCYKMHVMVKNKNPLFLRFYEITMIILTAVTVLVCMVSGYRKMTDLIKALLEAGIIFFAWTTYFRKSVRVRTYFGSDEYLKKSIFFKNCEAPQPANIVYNNEEKIDE